MGGVSVMAERGPFEGVRIVVVVAAIAVAMAGLFVATQGAGEDGLRVAIRASARMSLVLFLVTFVASSVNALWRRPLGKWMLRNRKFLGNGFAASHAVHGVLVAALAGLDLALFLASTSAGGFYGGLFGYVVLAAMVITSFEGPTRRLGRKRWRVLHKAGMYVFFAIFLVTYLPFALAGSAIGIAATLALLTALALRIAAHKRATSR